MTHDPYTHAGYPVFHCWYYRLGGAILRPRAIQAYVRATQGRGYMVDDIDQVDRMAEPQRSAKLRDLKAKFENDLKSDLSGYRALAFQILADRKIKSPVTMRSAMTCTYTAISLKFAHLYNDFAHLNQIGAMLGRQGDLFQKHHY